jgi:hypothetical protein
MDAKDAEIAKLKADLHREAVALNREVHRNVDLEKEFRDFRDGKPRNIRVPVMTDRFDMPDLNVVSRKKYDDLYKEFEEYRRTHRFEDSSL